MNEPEPHPTAFEENRNLLFTLAYDVLGTVADAEDVVQETWLRWDSADRSEVRHPRAYLARIATRQALDRQRRIRRRREDYIGPWLPEPLVTDPRPSEEARSEDPLDDVVRTEDLTFGLQVVLQSLSPPERAAFVLREAFGFEYAEIARILDRSPAAVRQLTHRAREHVQARRPRFDADRKAAERVARRFLDAALGSDVTALLDTLDPDGVLYTDGGGRAPAARRPVRGANKIARLLAAVAPERAIADIIWLPGESAPTALLLLANDVPYGVVTFETTPSGHRIHAIHAQVNPDKLGHASTPTLDG